MLQIPKGYEKTRILGIDPGTDTLGISVLEVDTVNKVAFVLYANTFKASTLINTNQFDTQYLSLRHQRLKWHGENIIKILADWNITAVAAENAFLGRFAQSYAALTEVLYVIQNAVYEYNPIIPFGKVESTVAKMTIGAPTKKKDKNDDIKLHVHEALKKVNNLIYAQTFPYDELDEHSTDAITVAYWLATKIIKG